MSTITNAQRERKRSQRSVSLLVDVKDSTFMGSSFLRQGFSETDLTLQSGLVT